MGLPIPVISAKPSPKPSFASPRPWSEIADRTRLSLLYQALAQRAATASPRQRLGRGSHLAVEVVSPTDYAEDLLIKVDEYLRVGVVPVLGGLPSLRVIHVYESMTRIKAVHHGGLYGREGGAARLPRGRRGLVPGGG